MKLTKALETEVLQVYDGWLQSYLTGDVEVYNSYLDDDYHFIGSTNNEEFLSRTNTANFFEDTAEQLAGKTQLRNETRTIEQYGELVFITHLFDGWFMSETEWHFYERFRFTSTLHKTKEGWRFIYQHFSTPDGKAEEGETLAAEQITRENRELRDAIKRNTAELEHKNRELEIEAALERVRSRSMAMHKSEELKEVIQVVYEQFVHLNIHIEHTGFIIDYKENDDMHIWLADKHEIPMEVTIPYFDTAHWNSFMDAKENGKEFFANQLTFEEKNIFYKQLFTHIADVSGEIKEFYLNCPGLAISTVLLDNVGLYIENFDGIPYSAEEDDILMRFGKVFQQTYTRFLDLQKAEAQAREAQIEAALERVRSRAMAMHKSDELNEVVKVLFEKLRDLQIPSTAVAIQTFTEGSKDMRVFVCGDVGTGLVINQYLLPYFDHPIINDYLNAHKKRLDFFVGNYSKKEKDSFYDTVLKLPELKDLPAEVKQMINESTNYTITMVPAEKSLLGVNDFQGNLLSESQLNILKRFVKVFDQAYTRFLDLQKAEVQAREAKVEAALERVRSRSLAMHKTDELQEVVRVVAEELKNTGVILDTGGAVICTYFQDSKDVIHWTATEDAAHPSVPYLLPYFKDELFDEAWASKNRGDDYFAKVFSHEVKNSFWKNAFELSDYRQLPEDYKKILLESESHGLAWAWSKNSAIMIPSIQGDLPSEEEKEILIRFANVFEQAYVRFLDLQKAEEQAREAEIEAALERVRARSMAMQHSDELVETSELLFQQIKELGIELWSCGFSLWYDDDTYFIGYNPGPEGKMGPPLKIPLTEDIFFKTIREAKRKGKKFFVFESEGESLAETYAYMDTLPVVGDVMRGFVEAGFDLPTYQVTHCGFFAQGHLMFITHKHYPEAHDIFKRFTKEFGRIYTRFLDLQKAEEQAREAKIETALEKVRSRTMGMQSSDELPEVANRMFLEVQALGIPAWSCGYNILAEDKKSATCWMSSEGTLQEPFKLRLWGEDSFDEMGDFVQNGKSMLVQELGGKALEEHYTHMKSFPDLKPTFDAIEAEGLSLPTYQINHLCKFTHGFLLFITYEEVPDSHDIFKRFTNVFEQTYTRFLDLQKAEEQARESEIQLALERVRARTMAMQHSDELQETSYLQDQQVRSLGIKTWGCAFNIYRENDSIEWFGNEKGILPTYTIPREGIFKEYYNYGQEGKSIHVQEFSGEECIAHYEYMSTLPVIGDILRQLKEANGSFPEYQIDHVVYFKYGYLLFITVEAVPEKTHNIFKRFTKEFERTYTRFLDLEKAEERARQAQIEASLERVRAKAMSMQNSDELDEVLSVLCEQFDVLGILPMSAHMTVFDFENNTFTFRETGKYGDRSFGEQTVDLDAMDNWKETVDKWKADKATDINRLHFPKEQLPEVWEVFHESFASMPEESRITPADYPDGIYHTAGKHPFGYIGMNQTRPATEEEEEIVIKFAHEFGRAYQRFLDLKKAEGQARLIREERDRLEIALNELNAAKDQLVQQEKLASLGQLTAGIAHEIKNPLNFVNNFSEVSVEMIEEVKDELSALSSQLSAVSVTEAGDTNKKRKNADVEYVLSILNDIEANLRKIHEHGSRADSIVKSMLEHSRGGSGKLEPTDLNALVKEFVNLSFHGMRAGKNPINVDIDLQLDEHAGDVSLIAEDFSRVILNLCNNAFDAMREKANVKGETAEGYSPKLSVKTHRGNEQIIVEIADNGSGIPEEMRDKIMQPFFTTKKGTEGTGLGLSITNDIIKAHGGSLDIFSNQIEDLSTEVFAQEGTRFTIKLSKGDKR